MRGFPHNLPVGSGLLLIGVGLFLTVTGLLVPSFVFYWNREYAANLGGESLSGSMSPGASEVMELRGGKTPLAYNVTVNVSGSAHAELISYDKDVPSQDWGIGTHFSRILTVTETVHVWVSNPSSSDWIDYEISAQEVVSIGYPSQYLPGDLPYVAALVVAGVVSLGIAATLLKRDTTALLSLVKEKGFWTCFLMPVVIAMDALITYVSIQLYGLAVESNPIIMSLYLTGLWAVVVFHLAAIFLVAGLSFLLYRFMVKSELPRVSKLALAVLFSVASAVIGEPVLVTSVGLLSRIFGGASVFMTLLFISGFWVPILFSCALSTYLSTVILEAEQRRASS